MRPLLATLALAVLATAQTCEIGLPVSFVSASGIAPQAVTPTDVSVLSPAGARATALRPAPAQRVELLIDGSSDMASGGLWRTSQTLAEALLAAAPRRTLVRLAAFEDKIAPMAPFRAPGSGYEAALAQAYRGFHPKGGAALYDALALSVAPPTDFRPGDAIIAIGSGFDDASGITATAAAQALQASQIRLFLVQLGGADSGEVGALVRDSGGEMLQGTAGNRAAVVQHIWQALQNQYWLTLAVSRGAAPGWSRLQLQAAPSLHGARILGAGQALSTCQSDADSAARNRLP